jgi:hypothetical protein
MNEAAEIQDWCHGGQRRHDKTQRRSRQINIGLITSVEKKGMSERRFKNVQKEE